MRADCNYHVMYMLRHFATFWGIPVSDETTNGMRLVINVDQAVHEASTILSLPTEKVLHVVSKLLDEGLLMAYDTEHFFIPNFELFDSFICYTRQLLGITTHFSEDYQTSMLAGDGEVLVRRTSPDQSEDEVEVEPTTQTEPAEILQYTDAEELEVEFDRIFESLQVAPMATPGIHGDDE